SANGTTTSSEFPESLPDASPLSAPLPLSAPSPSVSSLPAFASLPLFAPSIASDAPLSSPTFSVDGPAPPAFPESEAVLSPLSPLSPPKPVQRSEEHTSELQSRFELVCRLLLEKINS